MSGGGREGKGRDWEDEEEEEEEEDGGWNVGDPQLPRQLQ